MDSKFYVSLEAARLLKEKGFNESCIVLWDEVFVELIPASSICSYKNQNHPNGYYSAPSLLEAMDWLEDRGILITIAWLESVKKWTFIFDGIKDSIAATKILDYYYRKRHTDNFADRNECMRNAIERALELL